MTEKREVQVPLAVCQIRGPFVRLELPAAPAAQPGDAATKQRTFRMTANTGVPMDLGWYWGLCVVDLAGLDYPQQIPALLDHSSYQRVGYTTKLSLEAGGLVAEGKMLGNEFSAQIIADADMGFPWQASIGFEPTQVLEVVAGESVRVNGSQVQGPINVIKAARLREVTFTALGADASTSSEVQAAAEKGPRCIATFTTLEKTMTKKTEGAEGATPAKLTASDLRTQHPELIAEMCAEAAAAAVAAERERVTEILEAAATEQAELARDLIKAGKSSRDATSAIAADLKTRLAAARSATMGTASTTKSTEAAGGDAELDPKGAIRAQFADDDRGAKAYALYMKNLAKQRAASAAAG